MSAKSVFNSSSGPTSSVDAVHKANKRRPPTIALACRCARWPELCLSGRTSNVSIHTEATVSWKHSASLPHHNALATTSPTLMVGQCHDDPFSGAGEGGLK